MNLETIISKIKNFFKPMPPVPTTPPTGQMSLEEIRQLAKKGVNLSCFDRINTIDQLQSRLERIKNSKIRSFKTMKSIGYDRIEIYSEKSGLLNQVKIKFPRPDHHHNLELYLTEDELNGLFEELLPIVFDKIEGHYINEINQEEQKLVQEANKLLDELKQLQP